MKKGIRLTISIILITLIAANIGLYFALGYLEQTNRIHYGYRVESTEYREEDEMIYYRSDDAGYIKVVPNSSSELDSEEYIIEWYDLNRKRLWSCPVFLDLSIPIALNEHEMISIGEWPTFISSEDSVKKQYNYSVDNEVIFTYTH
ncbi:MAG: hypothetical protein ACXAB7_23275, partial [Candidatus Kariarchaeaceae archaeon]